MQNYIQYLSKQIDLTEEQIEIVKSKLVVKTFQRNEMLLTMGEVSSDIYFVEKGVIRSYTIDENGKEHVIQFGTENWLVTDRNSFLCKQEAKFYIQAIEESEIVLINEELNDFLQALNSNYALSQVKLLQNHVRHLQDRITSLLSDTAKTRYLAFIKLYPNITARVPQWMIASYLGITPESLSRVRKDIASHG